MWGSEIWSRHDFYLWSIIIVQTQWQKVYVKIHIVTGDKKENTKKQRNNTSRATLKWHIKKFTPVVVAVCLKNYLSTSCIQRFSQKISWNVYLFALSRENAFSGTWYTSTAVGLVCHKLFITELHTTTKVSLSCETVIYNIECEVLN